MWNLKMCLKTGIVVVFVFFYTCQAAPLETMDMHEVPEDVTRFQHFLEEFEHGEIRLLPTTQLLHGKFPLKFERNHHAMEIEHREKREIGDSAEPSNANYEAPGIDEDAIIRQYVRNEITRIFSCYQRLRCGYTKAQAEEDCKWLEHSSLYHQLMKILGIKNYPKKSPSSAPQGPLSQSHIHGGQQAHAPRQQRHSVSPNMNGNPQMQIQSDVSINPIHQNLQNGIRYGARPGQYFNHNSNANANANRNRRAYDSFYSEQKLTPISSHTE